MRLFNKQLRILLLTNGLILMASSMLGPIYALFVEKIGGSLLDASYAFGVFSLAAGFTALVSGKVNDRIKENELIVVVGYFILGFGFLAYTLVNSIYSLLAVQVLIGLGQAIYAPAFDAVYSKYLDGHKLGREWGAWEAIHYFTTALGAIIGGEIVLACGFDILFIIMSVFCFGASLYIYLLPRKVL